MASPTDRARWEDTARHQPSWADRNRAIAEWIPAGSSVLDVGAGSRNLRDVLPPGCRYQPVDLIQAEAGTRFADFNAWTIPVFEPPADVVVCSGVLEYLVDPGYALGAIRSWGRRAIVSYAAAAEVPDLEARRRAGWISHLTERALRRHFAAAGLRVARTARWAAQRLYELVPDTAELPRSLEAVPRWPVSLFRADASNVGDWFSAPSRHLPRLAGAEVDIAAIDGETRLDAPAIIGGGGLFADVFDERFQRIRFSPVHPVIGWGLGDNARIDTARGWVDETAPVIPAWAERCDLLGVRDAGSRAAWVPCASCLHPAFLTPRAPRHEVVVYAHKRLPIDARGLPLRTNDGDDLDATLDFLASGHVVVTNSYHGAYWATLLGRAVVAMPFSSKFWGLRHRPVFCRPEAWSRAVEYARSFPTALSDCREATASFSTQVFAMLGAAPPEGAGRRRSRRRGTEVWQTRDEIARGLECFGVGPTQHAMALHALEHVGPVSIVRHSNDLPDDSRPWRAVVVAPGARPRGDRLAARLAPTARVVLVDAGDPGTDAVKAAFREWLHVGADGDGGELWLGLAAAARLPAASGALPRVVSYFTTGTEYETEAAGLADSCARAGVAHDIRGLGDRGGWMANCATKAAVIRDVWRERREPLLWVDADARLHAAPELLRGCGVDFAVHKVDGWQFASGTIFFNDTPLAGRLLDRWVELCERHPHVYDQILLDVAWEETTRRHALSTLWLPPAYTLIFDRPEALRGEPGVIVHHQASRAARVRAGASGPWAAPEIPDAWKQARRAARAWVEEGRPAAVRLVGDPDFVDWPGTPRPRPAGFGVFEAAVSAWARRPVAPPQRVGIHGASWFGARLCLRLRQAGLEPLLFLDRDAARQAHGWLGLPVFAADPGILQNLDVILVASLAHAPQIVATLRASALPGTRILYAPHADGTMTELEVTGSRNEMAMPAPATAT